MPQVMTTNAVVFCPHGFPGRTTVFEPTWSVDGGFVLAEGDSGQISCLFPVPCVGYTLRSMGLNRTTLSGRRVILATDFNQTYTGLPLTVAELHTTIDDSTAAAVPTGQPGAPQPPELTDLVPPVVAAAPPALSFANAAPVPVLTTVFSLATDHPNLWVLTMLSEPTGANADVTNGLPPGLVVVPAGGVWDTPALAVTVTLTQTFLAGLTPGCHHIFMTGVSRRGLTGSFDVELTVS
jgi:hypothetical protein